MKNASTLLLIALWLLFPLTTATASPFDEIINQLKKKPTTELDYIFGSEISLDLALPQTILLNCSANPDKIHQIIISRSNHLDKSDIIFIYAEIDVDTIKGGGSYTHGTTSAFRALNNTTAITAQWSVSDNTAHLTFQLTNDRDTLYKKYKECSTGSFSGPWKKIIDINSEKLKLTPAQRAEVLARLWSLVKFNFANFDLVPKLDWDQTLTDTMPLAVQDQSNLDFAKLLTRTIAKLHDGHTDIMMAYNPVFPDAKPALELTMIDNRPFISNMDILLEKGNKSISLGDELIAIDNTPVQTIIDKDIAPYIMASVHQKYQYTRNYLMKGPDQSKVTLTLKNKDGHQYETTLTRTSDWRRDLQRKNYEQFEFKQLPNDIAYVAINTFGNSSVVDKFKSHLDQINTSKGLIIDIRNNGGGNSGNGDRIIRCLIDKTIANSNWKTPQYIAAFKAWNRLEEFHIGGPSWINPDYSVKRYSGPLVILLGPDTFSAAEDFALPLHAAKRATLIGQPSGGSTGQPLPFNLGFGIKGRICTRRVTYPDGRDFYGTGIIPDITINPTPTDLANQTDPALDKAIEFLLK